MEEKDTALLSLEAVEVVKALQHKCGTYEYYTSTLKRLFNLILAQSDEIGMDDTETVHTLRVLKSLNADLAYLAGRGEAPDSDEDTAGKVEDTFSGLQDLDMAPKDPDEIKDENTLS